MKNLRRNFMFMKICLQRSVAYLSLFNSSMILFLFLKEKGYDVDKYFIYILIIGFLGLILVGWIEIKFFKGLEEENSRRFELTPEWVDIKKKIDTIYEKIK